MAVRLHGGFKRSSVRSKDEFTVESVSFICPTVESTVFRLAKSVGQSYTSTGEKVTPSGPCPLQQTSCRDSFDKPSFMDVSECLGLLVGSWSPHNNGSQWLGGLLARHQDFEGLASNFLGLSLRIVVGQLIAFFFGSLVGSKRTS